MALASTTIIFGGSINHPVYANVAKAVGVSKSTMTRWKANPDIIPLGHFKRLCRVRELSDEQIIKIIRGK